MRLQFSTMTSPKIVTVTFCAFVLCFAEATLPKTVSELKREILDQILPRNDNEILVGPGNTTSGVTDVEVFMHILDIDKLSEEKMEFTVRLLLRQMWKDYRLKYDSKGQFKHIMVNDPEAIWTPDIFFPNEKKGYSYDITHPNVFIRIFPDGSVLYSKKISLTLSCPMDLKKYPFDKQECQLRMAPFGSTTDDVILLWRDYAPVTINRIMQIRLFELEKFVTTSGIVRINTGDYSYLTAYFYLSRTLNYYLYQIYIPSVMFVILSWLPFWMNKTALIGRLLISLGTLFTYNIIIYDYNKHHAKVSYSTNMMCFTGTCMTFLFISLVENIIVQIFTEKDTKTEVKDCITNGDIHKENDGILSRIKSWIAKLPCKTNYVDLGARLVVPISFMIFCIIYFSSASGFSEDDPIAIRGNQIKETLYNNTATLK